MTDLAALIAYLDDPKSGTLVAGTMFTGVGGEWVKTADTVKVRCVPVSEVRRLLVEAFGGVTDG